MLQLKRQKVFFEEGICFECQRCGVCCTGEPGVVFVHQSEVAVIAGFMKIEESHLIRRYLYPFQDHYSIREDREGACLFYDNGCRIYPVRPEQCRTYPFWFQNLRSVERWQKVAKECPGIGKGRRYGQEEILKLMEPTLNRSIMIQRRHLVPDVFSL